MADPAIQTPIPEPLLARLTELKPILVKQGCVQLKEGRDRRPSFRLRYRSHDEEVGQVHHSIPLGSDENVAGAVSVMIAGWKQEAENERKKAEETKLKEESEWKLYRQVVADLVKVNGGGRRMRTRALKALKEAKEDGPWALLRFAKSNDWLRPLQRGRPPTVASIW